MLTAQLLKQIFPLCADPAGWTQALNLALEKYQINARARLCCFLAPTGDEPGQLINNEMVGTTQRLLAFPEVAANLA